MNPFIPKNVILKNGEKVVIREAEPTDAQDLLNTISTYIPESPFIPKSTEEIKLTLEDEVNWIQSFLDSSNGILLLAIHKGEIVGNIDLTGHTRKAMQHTAVVGMGMLNAWQNIGLGTALMESGIEWARANPVLEKLWLEVYVENLGGVALYRKTGFEENGIVKGFFKQNGQYFDKMIMSLDC